MQGKLWRSPWKVFDTMAYIDGIWVFFLIFAGGLFAVCIGAVIWEELAWRRKHRVKHYTEKIIPHKRKPKPQRKPRYRVDCYSRERTGWDTMKYFQGLRGAKTYARALEDSNFAQSARVVDTRARV